MPTSQPDILFIMTDQQRFDTIAALGNSHIYTPNMDRLVRRGISFSNAYATCPVLRCCALHNSHWMRTGYDARFQQCEGECCGRSSHRDGSALRALPRPNDVAPRLSNFWSWKVSHHSVERRSWFRNNVALRRNLPSAKSRRR